MDKEIAIKAEHLSKTFRIPHEKVNSVKGAFVGMFRKRTYEEFQALDDVSFEVKKGEFFGIIGHNGSGKSTLLKVLAGIYQPDRGKVQINGMISPFLELGIGFNPELSGRDNIYLNATVLGMTRKQIDEKFDEIVAFSELARFLDQKLKNYSSGMQVRLAFSVAIHANRDILLMDEVLAVGDANFQKKCIIEFEKYKSSGKTVVLVSHDIATIEKYCDRAIILHDGGMVGIGKAGEMAKRYLNADNFQQMPSPQSEVRKGETATKHKRKEIEIVRVDFLDESGNGKNVFAPGDAITVRAYFKRNREELDEVNFGLAIQNHQNDYLMGINSIFDEIDTTESLKRGYFQVDIDGLPLNSDSYYVMVSIVKDDFAHPYDLLPRSQYFRVVANNRNEGIVSMKYKWS